MKNCVNQYLASIGYCNIEWHYGEHGIYITASKYAVPACIDLFDLIAEMLRKEVI